MFERLKQDTTKDWRAYTEHTFVAQLAAGTLPEAAFKHYLVQDYLFLLQFVRAYGLAIYKAEHLKDMRHALGTIKAILDTEMDMHVAYCKQWGITPTALEQAEEDTATLAYTRFVLATGGSGDLLALLTALMPCVVGYFDAASWAQKRAVGGAKNPYHQWLETYNGHDYAKVAVHAINHFQDVYQRQGGDNRYPSLHKIFRQATRLEVGFWEQGLKAAA